MLVMLMLLVVLEGERSEVMEVRDLVEGWVDMALNGIIMRYERYGASIHGVGLEYPSNNTSR